MSNSNDPPRNRSWDRDNRDDDDRPRRRRDDDDDRPRRRRDDDDDFDDRPRRRAGSRSAGPNGLAVAALVLGLLAIFTAGLTALPGLICGALALGKPNGRGMAAAGLVLSVLGGLVGVGVMYFAVTSVREAATRMGDSNNMKQVGIALHAEADRTGGFSPYAVDRRGHLAPGLSFRAGILPYIEQNSLYNRLDLSQPWDGPTNRSVTNTPIKTYTTPYDGPEPSVSTPYRVFVGGGALFNEDGELVRFGDITDGMSNTIMAVHATEQVPWAAPRELKYSPRGALPSFGHASNSKTFTVLMADGSVRNIRKGVPETTMRALITRAGNEAIPSDF
jgi:hypothetical protein